MVDIVLKCPRYVFYAIRSQFLDAKSVGRLDSALCSGETRELFLQMLRCADFSLTKNNCLDCNDPVVMKSALKWHVLRSVKVRSLWWTTDLQNIDIIDFTNFMKLTHRHLKSLQVEQSYFQMFLVIDSLHFGNLRSLSWYGRSSEFPAILMRSPNLTELTFPLGANLNEHTLGDVVLYSLDKITLHGLFEKRSYDWLTNMCPNVSSLTARTTSSSDHLLSVIYALPKLRRIKIDGMSMRDTDVMSIADSCPQLTHIHMNYVQSLTDAGFMHLCRKCSELESIRMVYCSNLTTASVSAIGEYLSNTIKHLHFELCGQHIDSFDGLKCCTLLDSLSLS